MKSWIITIAIAATSLCASADAEARSYKGRGYSSHVYVSGYRSCGTPIYQQRYVIRYQHCGTPVWGYRVVAPPRAYCPPPRPRCYVPPVCPPPYVHTHGGYRGGVVIQGSFRR